jgi:hypothetical protein
LLFAFCAPQLDFSANLDKRHLYFNGFNEKCQWYFIEADFQRKEWLAAGVIALLTVSTPAIKAARLPPPSSHPPVVRRSPS